MTLPVFKHAIKRDRQTESCSTSSFELASSSAACQLRHSYKVQNCSAPDMLYDSTMRFRRILYSMNLDVARLFGNEDQIIFWVIGIQATKANIPTEEAWNFAAKKNGYHTMIFRNDQKPLLKKSSRCSSIHVKWWDFQKKWWSRSTIDNIWTSKTLSDVSYLRDCVFTTMFFVTEIWFTTMCLFVEKASGFCCKQLLCTELFVCLRMLVLNASFLCLQLQKALVQSDVNFLTSRQCTHEIPRVFSNLNASRWHWSSSRRDASSLQYDFGT